MSPQLHGELTFHVEPRNDVIVVRARGLWTVAEVQAHFRSLTVAMELQRKRKGAASVMVDLRDALVQSAEVAAEVKIETARLYKGQDRAAVICGSMLQLLQMRKVGAPGYACHVLSEEEALAWLAENRTDAHQGLTKAS